MNSSFGIAQAASARDLADIVDLFRAYASSIDIELGYQDFEAELVSLPGKYAPPAGALFLARNSLRAPIGCVALRPLPTPGCCEMKRLYVSPGARGMGLGRALVQHIIGEAVRLGYAEMFLDTLPTMTPAIALYEDTGFKQVPRYYDTPIAETVFFARRLVS
jgi:ribosomal protein S18 acetylase RimI-like enzyme